MVQVWVKYDLNWVADRTDPVSSPAYTTSIGGYTVPVYVPWAQPSLWPDSAQEFIVTPLQASLGNYQGGVSGFLFVALSDNFSDVAAGSYYKNGGGTEGFPLHQEYPFFTSTAVAISLTQPFEPTPQLVTITRHDDFSNVDRSWSILDYVWRLVTVETASPSVSISISGTTSASEPDVGFREVLYTISLDKASDSDIVVNYSTVDETAVSNVRYVPVSAAHIFKAGETQFTFSVKVIGDTIPQGAQAFHVKLDNAIAVSGPSPIISASASDVRTVVDDPPIREEVRTVLQDLADASEILKSTLDAAAEAKGDVTPQITNSIEKNGIYWKGSECRRRSRPG
jgi:hypothetical protein